MSWGELVDREYRRLYGREPTAAELHAAAAAMAARTMSLADLRALIVGRLRPVVGRQLGRGLVDAVSGQGGGSGDGRAVLSKTR